MAYTQKRGREGSGEVVSGVRHASEGVRRRRTRVSRARKRNQNRRLRPPLLSSGSIESCKVLFATLRRGPTECVSEAAGDAERRRRALPPPRSASLVRAILPSRRPRPTRRRARGDRHLRVEENSSTGVTPYTASFGDASRFRRERGVARRMASHRTYPESPKMITFSRVRLRDAMVPGSFRCAWRTRECRARTNEDGLLSRRAGGGAHRLQPPSSSVGLDCSSRRRKREKVSRLSHWQRAPLP